MPWTNSDFPDSMKNLDSSVRHKAIEIANALLKDGHDDGSAIRIAISRAKQNKSHDKRANFETDGLVKLAYKYKE